MFHVKHYIEKSVKELGIKPDKEKINLLLFYLEELIKWNEKINLVSKKLKKEEILKKLILPSLIPYKMLRKGEKILDFGAGGGIVGIPLKIFLPETIFHFLEAKQKRVVFLEYIASILKIDIKVIKKFVKEKEELEESYDWVLVRGVNPERVPKNIGRKIIYYGKYKGNKLICENELRVKENIVSILSS
ncbi:MAG: RsmG family class I SAM-dependent methyltransferase [candidate division WOR-3 bacterium]